jgi:hypothetical protein
MSNDRKIDGLIPNERVSYSETRTINIGNFEKIETFFNYSFNFSYVDMVNRTLQISHGEEISLDKEAISSEEEFKENALQVVGRVKRVLDAREKQIRVKTAEFVDFHTLKKLPSK